MCYYILIYNNTFIPVPDATLSQLKYRKTSGAIGCSKGDNIRKWDGEQVLAGHYYGWEGA